MSFMKFFKETKNPYQGMSQLQRVESLMSDGQFRTLNEISSAVSAPEQSVSARLRDLRKSKFGGYNVTRRKINDFLYEYKVEVK